MGRLVLRDATLADLPRIVAMLADDQLGKAREDASLPLHQGYERAFNAILVDSHQFLFVAELADTIVGTFQLSLIPGLARRGAWRGQIETVRVVAEQRGTGIGAAMIRHAITLCRDRGCASVQLTTNKQRHDAQRFYARLGFVASHEGFKLAL